MQGPLPIQADTKLVSAREDTVLMDRLVYRIMVPGKARLNRHTPVQLPRMQKIDSICATNPMRT